MVAVAERRSRLKAQKGSRGSWNLITQWYRRNTDGSKSRDSSRDDTVATSQESTAPNNSKPATLVTPPKEKQTRHVPAFSRLLDFCKTTVGGSTKKHKTAKEIVATQAATLGPIHKTLPQKKQHDTKHSRIRRKNMMIPPSISSNNNGSSCLAISHALQDEVHLYVTKHPELTKQQVQEISHWSKNCQEELENADQHLLQQRRQQDALLQQAEMERIRTDIERLQQECMDMDVHVEASRFLYEIDAQR